MPLALEPGQSFPVVLESDKGKDNPPTFFACSCSMRDQRRISSLNERWSDPSQIETVNQLYSEAVDLLGELLTNWTGMVDPKTGAAIPFDPENVDLVLSYGEARELINLIRNNQFMTPEQKKSSESSPQSDVASSAEAVAAPSV